MAGSLEQIPAAAVRANPALVVSGDLDRAGELAGVERPTSTADTDAVFDWALAISGGPRDGGNSDVSVMPLDALRFERLNRIDEIDDELGWSILDVADLRRLDSPPEHLALDDRRLRRRADRRGAGRPHRRCVVDRRRGLRHRPVRGERGPSTRQSVRTALDDGRLGESASTATIEAWLAGKDTLGDDEAMHDVAAALDDHDVYSAIVVSNVDGLDADEAPPVGDDGIEPADVFAAGAAHDGDGAQVVIAVRNADEDAAERNAVALRALFEDGTRRPTGGRGATSSASPTWRWTIAPWS